MDINEKIEGLKNQQEQAREVFLKCQGAIEILNNMLEEKKEDKSKDKKEDKK